MEPNEELIDNLIAVSVIAKRLAERLRKEALTNEQNERPTDNP